MITIFSRMVGSGVFKIPGIILVTACRGAVFHSCVWRYGRKNYSIWHSCYQRFGECVCGDILNIVLTRVKKILALFVC